MPMRVQLTLLLAAAMSSTIGCGRLGCRDIPSKDFAFTAMLDEADVKVLLEDWGFTKRDTIPCETACIYAFARDDGWHASDIMHCELEIADEAGKDPTTPVGQVACDGVAVEGYCE